MNLSGSVTLQTVDNTWEFLAIDGLPTSAVALCKITPLQHKAGDDAMEATTLVPKTMLSSGKFPEIPRCLWHNIIKEPDYNAACRLVVNTDVKL